MKYIFEDVSDGTELELSLTSENLISLAINADLSIYLFIEEAENLLDALGKMIKQVKENQTQEESKIEKRI